jgi:hypothetical protein
VVKTEDQGIGKIRGVLAAEKVVMTNSAPLPERGEKEAPNGHAHADRKRAMSPHGDPDLVSARKAESRSVARSMRVPTSMHGRIERRVHATAGALHAKGKN